MNESMPRKSLAQSKEVGCLSVLGISVTFVTSLSFSTPVGWKWESSYETPLRVNCLASFLVFGMVLQGKELELELVRIA
ncbi:hypothetical protein Tco_0932664 [Tanacetum coccineum]